MFLYDGATYKVREYTISSDQTLRPPAPIQHVYTE